MLERRKKGEKISGVRLREGRDTEGRERREGRERN